MAFVASIVEGQGDEAALPPLLHRIANETIPGQVLRVNPPHRVNANRFLNNEQEFSRVVHLQAAKAAQSDGFLLILLDCEDDCPAELGPSILERARAIRSDVTIIVVLAYREFESWFEAAAHSLQGCEGLPKDLAPPGDSTAIRDAKGWLSGKMGYKYNPVVSQAALCRVFNLEEACGNRSFARFYGRVKAELFRYRA